MELKNKYTRKIDREYNNILLENSTITTENGETKHNLNLTQLNKANDYLVIAMTGKTQEEVDELSPDEFSKILEAINKHKQSLVEKKKN